MGAETGFQESKRSVRVEIRKKKEVDPFLQWNTVLL